jgi:antitoxin component of MazEF toxin-antitoxin module
MSTVVRLVKCFVAHGVRLARDVAKRVGLFEGVRVDSEASEGRPIISSRSRHRFAVGELLKNAKSNREHELEDDGPKGAEIM